MIESLCLYLLCLSSALLCYNGFQNHSLIRSTSCSCSTCCFGLHFQLQNQQDFIKISRALIKDIFLSLVCTDCSAIATATCDLRARCAAAIRSHNKGEEEELRAPEPERGDDAEPVPPAAPTLDDPFAVDVGAAAAAVPRPRRRTTGVAARERDATRRDASRRVSAQQAGATPGTSAPK